MNHRMVMAVVALAVAVNSAAALAQSNMSSFYLSNRTREIRRATSASYFENRASTNSIFNQAARRYDFSPVNNRIYSGLRQKPFSSANPQGSGLSPYLGLGGIEVGSVPNYYSVVRPQLEQQRFNERAQREAMAQQQELTQMAAGTPYGAEGTRQMLPTGHSAVFMNFFGYYPQPTPRR